ncbi:acyl-CoA thioesterase [Chelatococcus asaccharovorans]|uniref:acyl-CoA thioesterase n=1 Tax=Chelatococcus asaccharovorans TaxID=28210 RepID=UPI00224C6B4E|nr:thioesterase family protein [Chelatococcus asaccharovorans]CAH1664044.1 4-hydroxybenzoyl-CoA thioesterase/acyl-CoA thioester hydrolase [Chelatococcus asaccharovorans]CAH1682543.1 4-hydroxybenzoyl-CoA thioesterase/acyl-CoA thioester hydrolase [Chelatococcus asaccharovorans]
MPRFTLMRASNLPPGIWRCPLAIRFGHCDPAGIVYTPQYFHLFNTVLEDWYGQALGTSYYGLIGSRRIGLGYAHASADFATPARMGETLEVAVVVDAVGRSSVTLCLHAFKNGIECARANFVTVVTSLIDHKAMLVPDDLRSAFEAYRERCRMPEPPAASAV